MGHVHPLSIQTCCQRELSHGFHNISPKMAGDISRTSSFSKIYVYMHYTHIYIHIHVCVHYIYMDIYGISLLISVVIPGIHWNPETPDFSRRNVCDSSGAPLRRSTLGWQWGLKQNFLGMYRSDKPACNGFSWVFPWRFNLIWLTACIFVVEHSSSVCRLDPASFAVIPPVVLMCCLVRCTWLIDWREAKGDQPHLGKGGIDRNYGHVSCTDANFVCLHPQECVALIRIYSNVFKREIFSLLYCI